MPFASTQQAFQEVWNDFRYLPKIRHLQNHGLQPRLFAQNRSISDPFEITPNLHQQSRKQLKIYFPANRRRFREFGTIFDTYPNPPCSKPWAMAQAFCSKSADFGPLRIHLKSCLPNPKALRIAICKHIVGVSGSLERFSIPTLYPPSSKPWAIAQAFCSKSVDFGPFRNHTKSTPTISKVVENLFSSKQEAFQRVWNDFRHLPKSAMFKTMGYSPGFLLKIGRFRTLANSPQIFTNNLESSYKYICKQIGGVSGSLERFSAPTQIRHVQNHGLQPRLFAQNRPIQDPCEFT